MKQHPIPQHIASYRFRLIGQMTLKQFLEMSAGVGAGWLIYTLNLPGFIKWPLVLFACFIGLALAFLPIHERPLDRWIINFVKAVYLPTQYIWKKKPKTPDIFLKKKTGFFGKKRPDLVVKKDQAKLKEYLNTLPAAAVSPLEKKQLNHLKKIAHLLGTSEPVITNNIFQDTSPLPPMSELKSSKIKIRKLGLKKKAVIGSSSAVIFQEKKTQEPQKPLAQPSIKNQVSKPAISKPVIEHAAPLAPPILIDSSVPQKLDPVVAAQFSTTLPIPSTPEVPNLIVGMVLNDMDKILPNTLIEITNPQKETVRALKTNKLGQFFCAQPLKNGSYQLKVEHPDYKFDIIEFKAEGKIIPPIKIKAKKRINF